MSLKGSGDWVRQPKLDSDPLDWARDRDEVRGSLHRQAQRWRALLSGEKAGRDMLKSKDYLRAIRVLMGRAGRLMFGLLVHLWFLVLLALGLIAAAIYLLAHSDTTTSNIAAIAAFAAGLGVTWKGIGGALTKAAAKLEEPLWGAALNIAIAEAITQLPGVAGGPPRGWSQADPDPTSQPTTSRSPPPRQAEPIADGRHSAPTT